MSHGERARETWSIVSAAQTQHRVRMATPVPDFPEKSENKG